MIYDLCFRKEQTRVEESNRQDSTEIAGKSGLFQSQECSENYTIHDLLLYFACLLKMRKILE